MEQSILTSTKKLLGVGDDYTAFDPDILTFINSTFAIARQFGVGPVDGVIVEDSEMKWEALELPPNQLSLLKSYMFLRVRMLFDPPTTGILVDAMQKELQEYEQRLSMERETSIPVPVSPPYRVLPVYDEFYYYYDEVIESL